MLASTPLRNSRPELIVDDGQGVVTSGASYSLARTQPGSGTLAQVYQQERHIGPIDSGMPAKTLVEGAYSHRRMSLKTGIEVGGSRVPFLVIFGSFWADQREAR